MKFLIVVVVVLATGMSVESRGRIFGGSDADPTKFNFFVKITVPINSTGGAMCGGALISYSWCLTAAHCFDFGKISNTEVALGLNKDHHFTKTVKAKRVIKHKDYHANETSVVNDIAVVEIPEVLHLQHIRSIWLARESYVAGEIVTVAGFGLTGISSLPSKLQVTNLKVMDDKTCTRLVGNSYRTTQFCSYNIESSICSGDSGGPVTRGEGEDLELVGIVSFSPTKDCSEANPSGYTRVSSYLQWIKEITGLKVV